jgi:hypothetical protein
MQDIGKQHSVISASSLNLSGVTLDGSSNSPWFDVKKINQITVEIDYTNTDGTGVKFSIIQGDGTTERYLDDEIQAGGGVRTCAKRVYEHPATSSENFAIPVEINAEKLRIADLTDINSGAAATNKATVRVVKGMV